jgi:putative transposase
MFEEPPHRRSIRLKGRDYSWPGTYFVTICTAQRKSLLGRVEDGVMRENVLGRLVRAHWMQLPREFACIELDVFIVMPNHIHGMISLHRQVSAADPQHKPAEFAKPQTGSISWIVRTFKARATREARLLLNRPELNVWQRNYFDRVVRNGKEYEDAYRYISENPRNWNQDEENLSAKPRFNL